MTWLRIDDGFTDHPKVWKILESRPEALALDVAAKCFCARHLTDGIVDKSDLKRMVPWQTSRITWAVKALVVANLWDEVAPGVWRIHDYLDYNPSRKDVLDRRDVDRQRQQRHREMSRRDSRRDSTRPVPAPIRDKSLIRDDPGENLSITTAESSSSLNFTYDDVFVTTVDKLSHRLADLCEWQGYDEASWVVTKLAEFVDLNRIDELIGHCATLNRKPRRPRYLLSVAREWALQQGIAMPQLSVPS